MTYPARRHDTSCTTPPPYGVRHTGRRLHRELLSSSSPRAAAPRSGRWWWCFGGVATATSGPDTTTTTTTTTVAAARARGARFSLGAAARERGARGTLARETSGLSLSPRARIDRALSRAPVRGLGFDLGFEFVSCRVGARRVSCVTVCRAAAVAYVFRGPPSLRRRRRGRACSAPANEPRCCLIYAREPHATTRRE